MWAAVWAGGPHLLGSLIAVDTVTGTAAPATVLPASNTPYLIAATASAVYVAGGGAVMRIDPSHRQGDRAPGPRREAARAAGRAGPAVGDRGRGPAGAAQPGHAGRGRDTARDRTSRCDHHRRRLRAGDRRPRPHADADGHRQRQGDRHHQHRGERRRPAVADHGLRRVDLGLRGHDRAAGGDRSAAAARPRHGAGRGRVDRGRHRRRMGQRQLRRGPHRPRHRARSTRRSPSARRAPRSRPRAMRCGWCSGRRARCCGWCRRDLRHRREAAGTVACQPPARLRVQATPPASSRSRSAPRGGRRPCRRTASAHPRRRRGSTLRSGFRRRSGRGHRGSWRGSTACSWRRRRRQGHGSGAATRSARRTG